MHRYFLELAYNGKNYSGFQIQNNAISIQGVLEKVLKIYFKFNWELTGSSRTDAGVHAKQNYFQADFEQPIIIPLNKAVYHINAILPSDIVVKKIFEVPINKHCRFNANTRVYHYYIYENKNPFLTERAWYYPYKIDKEILNNAAKIILNNKNFIGFSKAHTQVFTYDCNIITSEWVFDEEYIYYKVEANRFLRGMVRALVATMMQFARGSLSETDFLKIVGATNTAQANFAAPAHALFLEQVKY